MMDGEKVNKEDIKLNHNKIFKYLSGVSHPIGLLYILLCILFGIMLGFGVDGLFFGYGLLDDYYPKLFIYIMPFILYTIMRYAIWYSDDFK